VEGHGQGRTLAFSQERTARCLRRRKSAEICSCRQVEPVRGCRPAGMSRVHPAGDPGVRCRGGFAGRRSGLTRSGTGRGLSMACPRAESLVRALVSGLSPSDRKARKTPPLPGSGPLGQGVEDVGSEAVQAGCAGVAEAGQGAIPARGFCVIPVHRIRFLSGRSVGPAHPVPPPSHTRIKIVPMAPA
jgi:hypothetical protein